MADDTALSISDFLEIYRRETYDVSTAARIRLRELERIVDLYATGSIDRVQAEARYDEYRHKWGDAMFGVIADASKTDMQLANEIQAAYESHLRVRRHTANKRPSDKLTR